MYVYNNMYVTMPIRMTQSDIGTQRVVGESSKHWGTHLGHIGTTIVCDVARTETLSDVNVGDGRAVVTYMFL